MSSPSPSSLPNMTKPVNQQKCSSIYWNLIEMLEGTRQKDASEASTVLRELGQTQRCDKTATDLSSLRKDVHEFIGDQATRRILQYEATDNDRERAIDAIAHYHYYARRCLAAALPYRSQLYYHTLHQAERGLLVLTGLGAGAALGKWVHVQHKRRLAEKLTQLLKQPQLDK